jgi:hypothetical protein
LFIPFFKNHFNYFLLINSEKYNLLIKILKDN